MAKLVEQNVWESDFGGPDPELGFGVTASAGLIDGQFGGAGTTNVSVTAGSKWTNDFEFQIGDFTYPTDLAVTTYPVYRGALEVMARVWPCPWALAYMWHPAEHPLDVEKQDELRGTFEVAWIGYLSAPLAFGLKPPPGLVAERTPGGGLILSAVQTRIDQAKPDHMRRSRELEAIMLERVGVSKQFGPQPQDHPARIGSY